MNKYPRTLICLAVAGAIISPKPAHAETQPLTGGVAAGESFAETGGMQAPQAESNEVHVSLATLNRRTERKIAAGKKVMHLNGIMTEAVGLGTDDPFGRVRIHPLIAQRRGEKGEKPSMKKIYHGDFAVGSVYEGKNGEPIVSFARVHGPTETLIDAEVNGPDFAVPKFQDTALGSSDYRDQKGLYVPVDKYRDVLPFEGKAPTAVGASQDIVFE